MNQQRGNKKTETTGGGGERVRDLAPADKLGNIKGQTKPFVAERLDNNSQIKFQNIIFFSLPN